MGPYTFEFDYPLTFGCGTVVSTWQGQRQSDCFFSGFHGPSSVTDSTPIRAYLNLIIVSNIWRKNWRANRFLVTQ